MIAGGAIARHGEARCADRQRLFGRLHQEAGLLDGRRATTHWRRTRKAYPQVKLEADHIFVRDGDVRTSAGISAASICRWR